MKAGLLRGTLDMFGEDFIPSKIEHREEEAGTVASTLSITLQGGRPSHMFIYGPSGTGKTVLVKWSLNTITEILREKGVKMEWIYVNCLRSYTPFKVMQEITKEIGVEAKFRTKTEGTSGMTTEFIRALKSTKPGTYLIVVLDEVQRLFEEDPKEADVLLYNLHEANVGLDGKAHVTVISVSKDNRLKEKFSESVRSRYGHYGLVLNPYSAQQLFHILNDRANQVLHPGSFKDEVIAKCAKAAADLNGDARSAMATLRQAVEIAIREGAESLSIDHVSKAQDQNELDNLRHQIQHAPFWQKLVLWTIAYHHYFNERSGSTSAPVYTKNIYETVEKLARTMNRNPSLSDRSYREYLTQLEAASLIRLWPDNQGGRKGRKTLVELAGDKALTIMLAAEKETGFIGELGETREKLALNPSQRLL